MEHRILYSRHRTMEVSIQPPPSVVPLLAFAFPCQCHLYRLLYLRLSVTIQVPLPFHHPIQHPPPFPALIFTNEHFPTVSMLRSSHPMPSPGKVLPIEPRSSHRPRLKLQRPLATRHQQRTVLYPFTRQPTDRHSHISPPIPLPLALHRLTLGIPLARQAKLNTARG
jgi:hypothetical protein